VTRPAIRAAPAMAPGLRDQLADPARRVGEHERDGTAAVLARAATEGRFGSSDRYGDLLDAAHRARVSAELLAVLDEVDALAPRTVREEIRQAVNRAHVRGELDLDEVLERTDRLDALLTYDDARVLVADLGVTITGPDRRPAARRRRVARRVSVPAAAGGVGALLVALPAAVAFPADFGAWVPVVLFVGVFSAAGAALVAASVRPARAAARWWAPPAAGPWRTDEPPDLAD